MAAFYRDEGNIGAKLVNFSTFVYRSKRVLQDLLIPPEEDAMKYNKNIFDLSHELKRDRKTARRDYGASLMSSTKWRILMTALNDLELHQMIVKFIGVDREFTVRRFGLNVPHDFVDAASGPWPLISIEWIEVPEIAVLPRWNNLPAERIPQDLDAVRGAIAATRKCYRLEDTERGFRVIGHVR